jgi:hypothetical protein
VTRPTFPNPWITAVAPCASIPRVSIARLARNATPRPVASRRPTDPPNSTGLPVTTPATELPMWVE